MSGISPAKIAFQPSRNCASEMPMPSDERSDCEIILVADPADLVQPIGLAVAQIARDDGFGLAGLHVPPSRRSPWRNRCRARRARDRTEAHPRCRERAMSLRLLVSSVSIGLVVEQRECAEHARRIGCGRRVQAGLVHLGKRGGAEQAEAAQHLVLEQLEHPQRRRSRRPPPGPSIAAGRCRRDRRPPRSP